MKTMLLIMSLAGTLSLASNATLAGAAMEDAKVCNASIESAIAGLDPQPAYRLKGARGSQKRTMHYKLYLDENQYQFRCIVKRGEVLEIQWPEAFNTVLAEQAQRNGKEEVASATN